MSVNLDIVYAGKSLRDTGAIIGHITPMPRAKRNMELLQVPGRPGTLHVRADVPPTVKRTLAVTARSETVTRKVDAWAVESGELIVSTSPGIYFRAYQIEGVIWSRPARTVYEAEIAFDLLPYWYLRGGKMPVTIAKGGKIINAGNTDSQPVITVEGTGNITLYIGNQVVTLTGLADGITLDCEMQMAMHGGQNASLKMGGNYPTLPTGATVIDWAGDVRALTIIPRWRNE